MTIYYKTVNKLHMANGLPEDDVLTTFHFQTTEVVHSAVTASHLNGHVAAAYNAASPTSGHTVAAFLADFARAGAYPTVETFSEDGGSPLAVDAWAGFTAGLDAPTAKSLPQEVACCLSINADLLGILEEVPDGTDPGSAPDRPRARRRGRVYIGPLNPAAATSGAGLPARPSGDLIQTLLDFGDFLANPTDATLTAVDATLVVWSEVDGTGRPVVRVSVDDAFDTQRRRGVKQSARYAANV